MIVVIWDDYETNYPDEYVGKAIEAYERFELPEEIHREWRERIQLLREFYEIAEKLFDRNAVRWNLRDF